jgi:LytS/YehU family sensor histidine kinase
MQVRRVPSFLDYILFPEILRKSVFAALLMLFMSGFIKIAQEWFKSEQQREALKVENLNAELKFLKSQINPHFLFNCLNTIYSLAHKHSAQTEHAIVKLSTIMRYMIYESNEDKVQLQQELQYLEDYIDIQRLRMPDDIVVDYAVQGTPIGLRIEPMLLVPFVENAFKHGISYAEPSFIAIAVAIEKNQVRLVVENSLFRQRVAEKGGIGLQNVRKRLELLYTEDHELEITEAENQFIVDLKIVLKNDQVYSGGR